MPPGVDIAHQKVRSASVILPPDQPFKDAAKEALRVRAGRGAGNRVRAGERDSE